MCYIYTIFLNYLISCQLSICLTAGTLCPHRHRPNPATLTDASPLCYHTLTEAVKPVRRVPQTWESVSHEGCSAGFAERCSIAADSPNSGFHGDPKCHTLGRHARKVSGHEWEFMEAQCKGKKGHLTEWYAAHPRPSQQAEGPGLPTGIQYGVYGKHTHITSFVQHNCLLSMRGGWYFWPCAINKTKCYKIELFYA